MPTPELTLEETGDMCLLLDAIVLPMPRVLPTNRRNCRDPHRKGSPRFVSKIPVVAVWHRVHLLSHNCVRAGRESDVA